MDEFHEFWARYPRKVGKLAAMKAFTKARQIAPLEDLLAGVAKYIQRKPSDIEYCHPTTWLTQGRWMDEDDAPPVARTAGGLSVDCPHTPPCASRWACGRKQQAERIA